MSQQEIIVDAYERLKRKLRPIMERIVPPLVRAGIRAPGDPHRIEVPGPVGSPVVTYDEGGGSQTWGTYTEADHERYRQQLARAKAGRVIDSACVPVSEDQEHALINHHVDMTVDAALLALIHLIGSHTSYPGHEACRFPSPLGSDLLPLCIKDQDIDLFFKETILDPSNFRAAMRAFREAFAAETALFKLLRDAIGIDFLPTV